VLLPITALAFIGVGVGFWQRRKRLSQLTLDVFFFLGITLFFVWSIALVRGSSYLLRGWSGFVVARYAYPAILPTILFFSAGWLVLLQLAERKLLLPIWVKYLVYFGGLFALNIYSWISIYNYYQ
jgi:hypothetical protein